MTSESELATRLLEVVPSLMHQMQGEIRAGFADRLTVPQFRLLVGIRRGLVYVGQIAEHQGISQPAISKMVAVMVRRGLVQRRPQSADRRQVRLRLTPKGSSLVRQVGRSSAQYLGQRLADIDADKRRRLRHALNEIESLLLTRNED